MKFTLSNMEKDIMELFWEQRKWMSGANIWEIFNEKGKEHRRTTINTYLTRMTEKGLLVKNGTKYIYRYSKEEFRQKQADEILENMYDGSLAAFISAFLGKKKINKEDSEALKKYLDMDE